MSTYYSECPQRGTAVGLVPRLARVLFFALVSLVGPATSTRAQTPPEEPQAVSFASDVRPILRKHCVGCHQPAKPLGAYDMTSYATLVAGGESDSPAIVAGDVAESYLVDQITPDAAGLAEMPKGRPSLSPEEVDRITQWVAAGAVNDAPVEAGPRYTADNPPQYKLPPIITALAFSRDGELLAVSGHHEVLLHHPDGSGLVARLVGLSERIESIAFSPDGKYLAVAGGLPGRLGELQIWDVAERKLALSHTVTFDTLYGASWSPDSRLVAFGCGDATVRAIQVDTGEQVFFQGAHNDWVLDTVFSNDGTHLVSASRDMTLKLTVVETERFVDNITSITPGALKGGIHAVDRHPQRDELVVGGADGIPKLYRMHRLTKRVIGDDSNLIRGYPAMPGRIFAVAFHPAGTQFAAASSLDGRGEVRLYPVPEDSSLPEELKPILEKTSTSRSAEEAAQVEEYLTREVDPLLSLPGEHGSVYALAFNADGSRMATAGLDGVVRVYATADGSLITEFVPVPLQ